MTTNTDRSPREIDEALAAEYGLLSLVQQRIASLTGTAQGMYGERDRRIPGLKYLTTPEQAWERAEQAAANGDTYIAMYGRTPSQLLAKRAELRAEEETIILRIKGISALYTGWSRFFVVTSSAGHVHASMHCHTCRPTTTYGWLPDLSGKTEADAVEKLGPALCSVCFPTAPVAHQAKKLTKAQAAKVAA